ncbi:hypothetical protein RQP46_004136 [Phenoliferia psychrophenolica]
MPFIELPSRNLKMWYSIEPTGTGLEHQLAYTAAAPECESTPTPPHPGKPIIVFLHAGLASEAAFIGQLGDERLRAAFTLVTLDQRGHGRTVEDPVADPNVTDEWNQFTELLGFKVFLNDTSAAIEALGFKEIFVVGESCLGSRIALYLAATRPTQVKAVVLSNPDCDT